MTGGYDWPITARPPVSYRLSCVDLPIDGLKRNSCFLGLCVGGSGSEKLYSVYRGAAFQSFQSCDLNENS